MTWETKMDALMCPLAFFPALLKETEPVLLYWIFTRQPLANNFSAYRPTPITPSGAGETSDFTLPRFWEGSGWNTGLHAGEERLADLTRRVAGGPINTLPNWRQLSPVWAIFFRVPGMTRADETSRKKTSVFSHYAVLVPCPGSDFLLPEVQTAFSP